MDEKMEIRLVNPTEDGFLQKIDWNKAELEANVRSIVEAYQGLVYTEDTVSDAKNDRAALRKLLNEIEDRRKLVKKKCMEPYEVFENDLKDVTVLIKEQISIIDGQVKEYENGVKEEKKARLQDVYAETIGELAEVLPFERVFETQYLNVKSRWRQTVREKPRKRNAGEPKQKPEPKKRRNVDARRQKKMLRNVRREKRHWQNSRPRRKELRNLATTHRFRIRRRMCRVRNRLKSRLKKKLFRRKRNIRQPSMRLARSSS